MSFCCDAHPRIKTGIVACLRDRAKNICNRKHARIEKKYLKKVFLANGYTQILVHQKLYRHGEPQPAQEEAEQENQRNSFPMYNVSRNTYKYTDVLEREQYSNLKGRYEGP